MSVTVTPPTDEEMRTVVAILREASDDAPDEHAEAMEKTATYLEQASR